MTDTNQSYKRLTKALSKTRKSLTQTCHELGIDLDSIEDHILVKHIDQCSHCNIWSTELQQDLDDNPICRTCFVIAGA